MSEGPLYLAVILALCAGAAYWTHRAEQRIADNIADHIAPIRVPGADGEYYVFCGSCGLLRVGSGPLRYTHGPALMADLKWHRRVHEWGLIDA